MVKSVCVPGSGSTSRSGLVWGCDIPTVLRPSHSLLLVYTGKHLYDKNLNSEQEESIRNKFYSVMYLLVPSVQDLYSELLREI